jgi:hypothetical protein
MGDTIVRPIEEAVEEFGKDHGLIHEAVVTGRKVGAGQAFWKKLAHDEELFGKVVAFVVGDGIIVEPAPPTLAFQPTPSQVRAREILGKNFLGIEEAMRHYGAAYTEEQIATLAEIPFSEAEIEERKNDFLLVAGSPMTVLDIRKKAPNKKPKKAFYSYKDAWYNTQVFATNERVGVEWFWIRKTAVENSFSKSFADQQQLTPAGEEVPRACELIYAVVLYFMATGERLFSNVYVRCIDVGSDGYRVFVGYFDADGLSIDNGWDDDPRDRIGLSSARKSKK